MTLQERLYIRILLKTFRELAGISANSFFAYCNRTNVLGIMCEQREQKVLLPWESGDSVCKKAENA